LLWTVPNTFAASANCGVYCGANVISSTSILDVEHERSASEGQAGGGEEGGKLPKIVVPVHFAGHPTEQEQIWNLAQEFGFKVLRTRLTRSVRRAGGQAVGNCRWSDVTVFSFHPVKIITSGEGGMALTNDEELAVRMKMLRSHGITRFRQLLGTGRGLLALRATIARLQTIA